MASHNLVNMSTPSPPHSNPPPDFFSNGGSGATIPASMFNPQAHSSDDGGADAKRRRIARACDMCRKKKIKCDGKLPSCTHCVNYKTECVFTLVEKKRNPPKGAKYIEGLENRLGRMESLLKLSGLLPDGDAKTDLGDLERRLQDQQQSTAGNSVRTPSNVGRSSSESMRATPASSTVHSNTGSPKTAREDEEVEALSDQMCSLVTNNCGETRFIGSSSGFSIFSPKGIQWVNEKTGDKSFQSLIMDATTGDSKWAMWKPGLFGELFALRGRNPLPTKEVAHILIQDFFNSFNILFPLFHRPTFDYLFEKQYSSDPPTDSGWYAAFNMVLAIANRLRISHPGFGTSGEACSSNVHKSWLYFQNAATVLTELLLKNTDLMSIQAVLGMALFLQGTANPQPSYFLIAAAVRISNSIGMHRRGNSFGLNPVEVEQRRRIFWIMYLLDKDMALRSGRPPCINDDDISVELPDEDPPDGVGNVPLKNGKGKVNLFRLMSSFAIIESKVYMQLYSAKASKQSDGELLNTIGELDRELEDWKDAVPIEYRPENEICLDHGLLVLHVVVLHFAYYNCLTTIHRMSIHHGYWTSRLSNYAIAGLSARPLNPRVFSSAALCVTAARASIHLIKYINRKDYPCIWLVMYYPVSALVTLFANILQNPQDPRARSDLRLMRLVVEFLGTVQDEDRESRAVMYDDGSVGRMLLVCGEFERICKLVLDKAEKEFVIRRKRKNENSDSQTPFRPPGTSATSTTMSSHTPSVSVSSCDNPSPPTSVFNSEIGAQLFGSAYQQSFSPSTSFSWLNDMPSPAFPLTPPPAGVDQTPPVSSSSFQQPFVPQDLWQMPMTFEWDWAGVNTNMPWQDENGNSNGGLME